MEVRIRAKNRKLCPPWHTGAGNKAWIFADEILAQSPFERVTLDWDEARELMYDRNLAVAKAYESKQEATASSPLIANLMNHVQSSVGDTARGILSPDDLFKVAKSPFEELPKQFYKSV